MTRGARNMTPGGRFEHRLVIVHKFHLVMAAMQGGRLSVFPDGRPDSRRDPVLNGDWTGYGLSDGDLTGYGWAFEECRYGVCPVLSRDI